MSKDEWPTGFGFPPTWRVNPSEAGAQADGNRRQVE